MDNFQEIFLNLNNFQENNLPHNNGQGKTPPLSLCKEFEELLNSSESLLNILKGKDRRIALIEAIKPLLAQDQQAQIEKLYKFILLYEICKAFSNSY